MKKISLIDSFKYDLMMVLDIGSLFGPPCTVHYIP